MQTGWKRASFSWSNGLVCSWNISKGKGRLLTFCFVTPPPPSSGSGMLSGCRAVLQAVREMFLSEWGLACDTQHCVLLPPCQIPPVSELLSEAAWTHCWNVQWNRAKHGWEQLVWQSWRGGSQDFQGVLLSQPQRSWREVAVLWEPVGSGAAAGCVVLMFHQFLAGQSRILLGTDR